MNFSQATQPSMESSWFMGLATAVALALASYFLWWRWLQRLEFLRSSSRLPSPLAALPRWFGFIGGHSLLMKPGKVGDRVRCFGPLCRSSNTPLKQSGCGATPASHSHACGVGGFHPVRKALQIRLICCRCARVRLR